MAEWTAFAKHRNVFNGNFGMYLTILVYNSCVLPPSSETRTHQPNTEQDSYRKKKDGKEYVRHHIPGQKNTYLGKRKDKGHRRDWTSQRTDADVSRTRYHRWILRSTTWKPYEWKNGDTMERRARLILKGYHLAERQMWKHLLRPSPKHKTQRPHSDEWRWWCLVGY